MGKLFSSLIRVQGFYTLLAAVFAIVAIDSYITVAVNTVPIRVYSFLLIVAAIVFIDGTRHNKPEPFLYYFPFLLATGMLCIDLYGVFSQKLPLIYLADAYAQFILILAWIHLLTKALGAKTREQKRDLSMHDGVNKSDNTTGLLNTGDGSAPTEQNKIPFSQN